MPSSRWMPKPILPERRNLTNRMLPPRLPAGRRRYVSDCRRDAGATLSPALRLGLLLLMAQPELDRVHQRLPRSLDDVLADAYSPPRLFAVAGLDEDARHGRRAFLLVKHAHLVVGQLDVLQRREAPADGDPDGAVERVNRAVALGGGDEPPSAAVYLDRRLGHHLAVLALLHDYAERLELEELLVRPERFADQHLERAVRRLELVTDMLEFLYLLEDVAELLRLRVEVEAELLGFERDGRFAGQFGDHDALDVPHQLGPDVFVGARLALHAARVDTALVGERAHPDERLVRVGVDVRELAHVMREVGEPGQLVAREAVDLHLEREVRDDRAEVGVSAALAVAVDGPVDHLHTFSDGGQRARHGAFTVVVGVYPELHRRPGLYVKDDACDLVGERAAVCVA